MSAPPSVALLVRESRKTAGLTQDQLAERAGVSRSTISRLERGVGKPRFVMVERVLHAAGHRLVMRAVPKQSSN
jgi:transcriptional regulator with XRE-family HTH domain